MWTRKTVLFASMGVIMSLGGMIFNDYQLLILGIIFSTLLLFAYLTSTASLQVERILPNPKVFEEDYVPVILRITNKGRNLGVVEVYDKLPSSVKIVSGSNKTMVSLKPDETIEIEYNISCHLRGFYLIGPVLLRKRDFFSIFCDRQILDERSQLTVYPRIHDIKESSMSSKFRKVQPGSVTIRHIGFGTEFHSIRDYMTTDPFKKINWKVSARQRKLMVNQYELEDVYDTFIFIDARDITEVGTPLRNPLEFSIKAAVALAAKLMKRTNRVGLVIYGEKVKVIKPSSGELQMSLILNALTGTYSKGDTTFYKAITAAAPNLTPRSPVILLSPLDMDDSLEDATRYLVARKFNFQVLSPSSIDFEREVTSYFYTPKYLMCKLERDNVENRMRDNVENRMRAAGAKIIDWTPDMSIDEAIGKVGG